MLDIISICELQFDNRAQRRYINTADCPFSPGVPADGGRVQLCGNPRCKEERKTEEGTIKLFILGLCSSTAPSLFTPFLFPVLLSLSQQSRTLNHTPTEGVEGGGWFLRFNTRRKIISNASCTSCMYLQSWERSAGLENKHLAT